MLIPPSLHPVFEIDPAQKHFEGFWFEVELRLGSITWLRAFEAAFFQTLRQDPETSSIPIQHLHPVTPLVEEDEELGGIRVNLASELIGYQ